MQFDDIGMTDLFQYRDLPVSSLRICVVLECFEDFLEGKALLFFLERSDFPDMAVGSWSKFFDYFVVGEDMAIYLLVVCHNGLICNEVSL